MDFYKMARSLEPGIEDEQEGDPLALARRARECRQLMDGFAARCLSHVVPTGHATPLEQDHGGTVASTTLTKVVAQRGKSGNRIRCHPGAQCRR